ncbi:lantibiotic dehydratase [Sphaerimonospora cavernae]|uniref:Lantibiotic dehydratase n=1 Tax=Sphaerimonospora cavernae TaxID=1740611 RepID=A0ABV6TZQ2_9ACTN
MKSATLYQHVGPVLVRATTHAGGLDMPEGLGLFDDEAVGETGRRWLTTLWQHDEIRAAMQTASPVLARQIDRVTAGEITEIRQLRRIVISTASYMVRWQRRPTPFGLFAGIAAAGTGKPKVRFGSAHQLVAMADAQWLGRIIDDLERNPALLLRLPVVVNNTGFVRGDRFVVSGRSGEAGPESLAPLEFSIRYTRPVRAALAHAAEPIRLGELDERLRAQFPAAPPERITCLLADLVERGVLLTSLRALMTSVDSLDHLKDQLQAAGARDLPDVAELLDTLTDISAELSHLRQITHLAEVEPIRQRAAERMTTLCSAIEQPLALHVALDCDITIPDAVLAEAEAATTTLLRLTPNPFGSPTWKDYHFRFRFRYGPGAVVPVRELIADSGLGYPSGFLGAPRERAARTLTERDETLLALIQQAAADESPEMELTERVISSLAVGDHSGMLPPPRVELAFNLLATSPDALSRGRFQLWVTGAPSPASSMAGRFAHLLPEEDQRRLAGSFAQTASNALAAQLSFPPRKQRNENIARAPRLLSATIHLSEHHDTDGVHIRLDDLAVTADASQMHLVQLSTGTVIHPRVLHALEASVQTPPLARFLAEISLARCGVYGPFDFGAARRLPFLPRVRHGRTVLVPARWLLAAADLPAPTATMAEWEKALDAWRARWRVPAAVVLCQGELRLPLDLDHRLHRGLLRARLDRAGRVELRETPALEEFGWIGRAHELLVPLITTRTSVSANQPITVWSPAVAARDTELPGSSSLLYAQLFGHPARFDEILTTHLPHLLDQVDDLLTRWWFRRHRDQTRPEEEQHLGLYLRLRGPEHFGDAAERLPRWAADLHARGLLAHMSLATYQPQTGRYGHGAVMDAAEDVFATDSAAALAQLTIAAGTSIPGQAIAAASMTDLATSFAANSEAGLRWLINQLPRIQGTLERSLRDTALLLTDPADNHAALRALPYGETVGAAWKRRRKALSIYRRRLAKDRDPDTVLRSLLHDHHIRAVGIDLERERVTNRLARVAAQRQAALIERGTRT